MHSLQNKTFVNEIMQGTGSKSAKVYKKVFDEFEAFWQSQLAKLFCVKWNES